jgi:allophanate hydrolase
MNLSKLSFSLNNLYLAYVQGTEPREIYKEFRRRLAVWNDPALFLAVAEETQLEPIFLRLAAYRADELPLYGVPFALKDNLDWDVLPTTAACPAFAYQPSVSARVVELLIDAGAIPVGKTNMDQFATGLVGTRSPYGTPRNALGSSWIPGGSSSGSASAVAAGLVAFALGTDTAGSGRIPAAFQGLVGYKPTRGLFSTSGVVPACRSLDCVSLLTKTSDEALKIQAVLAQFDEKDPFSRPLLSQRTTVSSVPVLGVPLAEQREFWGDSLYQDAWEAVVEQWRLLGAEVSEIDYAPFREAAELLYNGPWVAERLVATAELLKSRPEAFHPITAQILAGAEGRTAVQTFQASYRLEALRRVTSQVWQNVDVLLLPTAPTLPTLAQVEADPVGLNSRLGYYTNFLNLLDMAALAMPGKPCADGRPFGFTLVGPAGSDGALFQWGALWEQRQSRPRIPVSLGKTVLAVAGAHMRGLPLNGQLVERGGRFLSEAFTAASYRLFTFTEGLVPKPGLVRVNSGGVNLPLELWDLPEQAWGGFLALIPHPLCLGKIQLSSGEWVTGFLMESSHVEKCQDITASGGWRNYLKEKP